MQLLIKNVCINDGLTEQKPVDVLIRNGIITEIAAHIVPDQGAEVWDTGGACVSPGWFDVGVQICDPGLEHREDIQSALNAAAAGGFTGIACFANTSPAIHSKSEVLYVRNKAQSYSSPVDLYPVGALSQNCDGKDLAELIDMHHAGAVAFADGYRAVQDAGLLLRALQYARAFDGLIVNRPHHKTVAGGGQMHEGIMSTSLGLKGIPALAEELMVQRDLSLLEYTGGRLHIHLVSTARSVDLIRNARSRGLSVTCSVAAVNLCFNDEMMADFDSNWKVMPPLRSNPDVNALRSAVMDGTVDFICSNHIPWHEEAKNLEFPYAEFGMTGLETAFSMCLTHSDIPVEMLIRKFALAPRSILGLPIPVIKEGEMANLTVFDPKATWRYNTTESRSANSPFVGKEMKGKILGVVNLDRTIRR
jgi:dihydroorotase